MSVLQPELAAPPTRDPLHVAPGDWARRGLVDTAFVERSVTVLREEPDATQQLQAASKRCLAAIGDIDRVYGAEPNAWATATRERLWLEHFTVEAIMRRLKPRVTGNGVQR